MKLVVTGRITAPWEIGDEVPGDTIIMTKNSTNDSDRARTVGISAMAPDIGAASTAARIRHEGEKGEL